MLKHLARYTLALQGWRLHCPESLPPRAVIVFYPHTSNWDAWFGLLTGLALGLRARWAAKDSLFFPPFGGLLRYLGGIPVNRRTRNGLVEQMSALFAAHPRQLLIIAPEGTRRCAAGWKSGFYRIALAAEAPILLGFADYARKEAGILASIIPSGDPVADMAEIATHYAGRTGKNPELASPVCWLE